MSASSAVCVGTVSAEMDLEGNRTYSVKYLVETSEVADQAVTAVRAPGIPSSKSYYAVGNDYDTQAFVRSYSPSMVGQDDHVKLWQVVVNYSTRPSQSNPGRNETVNVELPWQQPSILRGGGSSQQRLARFHYSNPVNGTKAALTNSAGAYYDDEYKEEHSVNLTIIKNYYWEKWSIETVAPFIDTVHTKEFFGAGAGYYKMTMPTFNLLYTGQGLAYFEVQYTFQGLTGGWNDIERVDEGYYYIDASDGGKVKRFSDDLERPISGKGRLDGTGDRLAPWAPTEYNYFNKYREKNFEDIPGLPQSVEDIVKKGK